MYTLCRGGLYKHVWNVQSTPRLEITISGSHKALFYVRFEPTTFGAVESGVITA